MQLVYSVAVATEFDSSPDAVSCHSKTPPFLSRGVLQLRKLYDRHIVSQQGIIAMLLFAEHQNLSISQIWQEYDKLNLG